MFFFNLCKFAFHFIFSVLIFTCVVLKPSSSSALALSLHNNLRDTYVHGSAVFELGLIILFGSNAPIARIVIIYFFKRLFYDLIGGEEPILPPLEIPEETDISEKNVVPETKSYPPTNAYLEFFIFVAVVAGSVAVI